MDYLAPGNGALFTWDVWCDCIVKKAMARIT